MKLICITEEKVLHCADLFSCSSTNHWSVKPNYELTLLEISHGIESEYLLFHVTSLPLGKYQHLSSLVQHGRCVQHPQNCSYNDNVLLLVVLTVSHPRSRLLKSIDIYRYIQIMKRNHSIVTFCWRQRPFLCCFKKQMSSEISSNETFRVSAELTFQGGIWIKEINSSWANPGCPE